MVIVGAMLMLNSEYTGKNGRGRTRALVILGQRREQGLGSGTVGGTEGRLF